MRIKHMKFGVVFLVLALTGCMPAKTWISSPVIQTADNPYFAVNLEPLKTDKNDYYNAFRLTVVNKTGKELVIDWSKTKYVYNGRERGGFVWKDIGAKNVKSPPPDIITAGETLSKVICPLKLIAYAPYRDPNVRPGERGFSCGVIPQGDNGIDVAVSLDGEEVREKIILAIRKKVVK